MVISPIGCNTIPKLKVTLYILFTPQEYPIWDKCLYGFPYKLFFARCCPAKDVGKVAGIAMASMRTRRSEETAFPRPATDLEEVWQEWCALLIPRNFHRTAPLKRAPRENVEFERRKWSGSALPCSMRPFLQALVERGVGTRSTISSLLSRTPPALSMRPSTAWT